jgi:hypothetical protein
VDSALTLTMVAAGVLVLLEPHRPGQAAALYLGGYAVGRFVLELFRGDAARPYWLGVSEAQWTSLLVAWGLVIFYRADVARLAVAGGITAAVVGLIAAWRWFLLPRYWLTCPWHIEELDHLIAGLPADGGKRVVTTLGLRLSIQVLPGGQVRDYLLSHPTRPLSAASVRAVARQLGVDGELRPGATAGLVHLLVKAQSQGQEDIDAGLLNSG